MYKPKNHFALQLQTNVIPFILGIFIISFILFPGCINKQQNENVRNIDECVSLVKKAENILVIDANNIDLRIDSMDIKLSKLDLLDKNRMNQELLIDLTSYKALKKNYVKFLSEYETLDFDNKKLNTELKDLKQKVIDKNINNKDFTITYTNLYPQCLNHYNDSKKVVQQILSQENMYQRINTKLMSLITNLQEV